MGMHTFSNAQNLSATSKRALNYTLGLEWFCQFRVSDLKGDFRYEEGLIRRYPNAVIRVTASHQLVFDRPHAAVQGQHSYTPYLLDQGKSAPIISV